MMKEKINASLQEAKHVLDQFLNQDPAVGIEQAAEIIAERLANGGKVISCGNGGSLCDATHFAEELTGRYRKNRKSYQAIAINDPAYITCVGNDFSFDAIFARYVEGVGQAEDVLLAISTSGNSENIVRAAQTAKNIGMKVIALTNVEANRLSELADLVLASPKTTYSDRIQEIHIKIIHTLIEAIEYKLGHY